MDRKMLFAAVLFGVLCAGCVFAYSVVVQRDAEAVRLETMSEYGGEQVEVLVATKDLYPGETLTPANTSMRLWVSDLLPQGAITNQDEAFGKKLTSLVLEGEAVSEKRFSETSEEIEVPEGKVALSVPAKEVQTVGGSLGAGSYVDVYAVGSSATCLGEKVLVLATSASSSDVSSGSRVEWVTLAVDAEKAQEYVAASEGLEIYFTLPAAKPPVKEADGGFEVAQSKEREASAKEKGESDDE